MCLCLCVGPYTCVCMHWRPEEESDPLGMELQLVLNYLVWVLGIKLGSSPRAPHTLTHRVISSALIIFLSMLFIFIVPILLAFLIYKEYFCQSTNSWIIMIYSTYIKIQKRGQWTFLRIDSKCWNGLYSWLNFHLKWKLTKVSHILHRLVLIDTLENEPILKFS